MSEAVFVERRYHTAEGAEILLRLGQPYAVPTNWSCDCVFTGDIDRRLTLHGVDGVQALQLALQYAATMLYLHEPAVHWHKPNDDLGLPTASSIDHLRLARTTRENAG